MRIILLLVSSLCFTGTSSLFGHGPGHFHGPREVRPAAVAALEEAVDVQDTGLPIIEAPDRIWSIQLNTGWESRHVHYGVNETGNSGAYFNEIVFTVGDFIFSAWNGFGIGNEFLEWDFTAAYQITAGPVFFLPGYNFRYLPRHVENGHHDHDDHDHGHGGHQHREIGHELFLVAGTTIIPYVTPTANFIWDLNNTPGALLEFRLTGDVPLPGKVVTLQPYTLLGLNFGYNTTEVYGLNNFQFGTQANVQLTRHIAAFAGVNYSVALEALDAIDQDNVFWVNVGLSFSY